LVEDDLAVWADPTLESCEQDLCAFVVAGVVVEAGEQEQVLAFLADNAPADFGPGGVRRALR
jgi:hypothetical protein